MWHYNKQKVIVLEGHWGSQTFANLHSNSEKKTIINFFLWRSKSIHWLTSLPWERSTSASSSKVWPKIRCLRFTSMLKTRIRKVRPQRLAGETCWKNQKRKKIEESFASFLCTTMQSGSSVVVCFTRNTLKKDMTKPSTIEFKVSSYSKVKKFRIRSLEDPEIRKLRIQKINKSVNSKIQIFG